MSEREAAMPPSVTDLRNLRDCKAELAAAREQIEWHKATKQALVDAHEAAVRREATLREALQAEIERVCECGGEDVGNGPGVGAIDSERSQFDYGAGAYDGAGHVITDYFDCPCVPLRAAVAEGEGEA